MKANIHPTYHQATVTCACGNTFTVGSTVDKIHVELCAQCHPFFTGTQKLVDTQGQVERFSERQKAAAKKAEQRAQILAARSERRQQTQTDKPSLRDLLMQARKQQA